MPAENRENSKGFFRMRRAELGALLFLVLYSMVSFLPVWRDLEIAGMVAFGWLMAALMLISPALMLAVFRKGASRGKR